MAETVLDQPTYATPQDPAWPQGYTATLWRTAVLPDVRDNTATAFPTSLAAREAAERDSGLKLVWRPWASDKGWHSVHSDAVPYKNGHLEYTIQIWEQVPA